MTVRLDKFKIGDKVTWFNDDYATMTSGRERYGNGPFTISSIEPVIPKWYRSAGHTQHVRIEENDTELLSHFSGAFFKKVD